MLLISVFVLLGAFKVQGQVENSTQIQVSQDSLQTNLNQVIQLDTLSKQTAKDTIIAKVVQGIAPKETFLSKIKEWLPLINTAILLFGIWVTGLHVKKQMTHNRELQKKQIKADFNLKIYNELIDNSEICLQTLRDFQISVQIIKGYFDSIYSTVLKLKSDKQFELQFKSDIKKMGDERSHAGICLHELSQKINHYETIFPTWESYAKKINQSQSLLFSSSSKLREYLTKTITLLPANHCNSEMDPEIANLFQSFNDCGLDTSKQLLIFRQMLQYELLPDFVRPGNKKSQRV